MPQKRCCHGQPGLQPGPQGHRSARAQRRVQGAPEAAAQPQVFLGTSDVCPAAPASAALCGAHHAHPQAANHSNYIREWHDGARPPLQRLSRPGGRRGKATACICASARWPPVPAQRCARRSRAPRRSGRADAAAAPQKITGAKSEALAHRAARKFARSIQRLGNPVQLKDFMIDSVMATCDVRFPILLESLAAAHPTLSSVRPRRLACA